MTSGLLMRRQDFARVAPWRPSKVQTISKDIGWEQFSSRESLLPKQVMLQGLLMVATWPLAHRSPKMP